MIAMRSSWVQAARTESGRDLRDLRHPPARVLHTTAIIKTTPRTCSCGSNGQGDVINSTDMIHMPLQYYYVILHDNALADSWPDRAPSIMLTDLSSTRAKS